MFAQMGTRAVHVLAQLGTKLCLDISCFEIEQRSCCIPLSWLSIHGGALHPRAYVLPYAVDVVQDGGVSFSIASYGSSLSRNW